TIAPGQNCCNIQISANIVHPSCGNNNGSISVTISPSGNYSYSWSNSVNTATNSNLGAGAYRLTVTNLANNCSKDTLFTLSNPNAPVINSINTIPESCDRNDGTATVSASGGTGNLTIRWSNNATGNTVTGLSNGTYSFTVTDDAGCSAVGTATIAPPVNCCAIQVSASATSTTCGNNNGSITVNITTAGNPPYRYSLDGVNYQSSNIFANLPGGTYTIYVLDNSNCGDTVTALVNPSSNNLVINFNVVQPGCVAPNSGSIDAQVSGGQSPYDYLWNNNATSNQLTNLAPGTYIVTVKDANNCTVSGSVTLNSPQPFNITLGQDTSFCSGSSISLFAPGGFSSYLWSNGDTSQSITISASNVYSVTVTNSSGCTASASVAVTVLDNPVVSLPADTTIYENNAVQLIPKITGLDNGTFLWEPEVALSCTNCKSPVAKPEDSITYVLTYTDPKGCTDTAATTIYVLTGAKIYMPNAFTPNGDGNNDILLPRSIGVKEIEWNIYNRWGEKIFETKDINVGWDGTYKGAEQPIGVYVYTMKVGFKNNTSAEYKGSVTLIR
ncbi:MAG: gliding motility-associated C-terminal domain-containing protein, partial [Chitinophagales bacterium]|nr:gliding motility-associated C-terminal domain-containing protein [Chitinophagales bacterium]